MVWCRVKGVGNAALLAIRLLVVASAICPLWASTALPTAPATATTTYAIVPDPVSIDISDDGILFVGRDRSGSGGSTADAAKIHRIGVGGPVEEFGNTTIPDPDAVVVDRSGTISGTPGAVLVGGQLALFGDLRGRLSSVAPDGRVTVLFERNAILRNPVAMAFDQNGRLLMTTTSTTQADANVVAVTEGSPVVLFSKRGASGIAVDGQNNIVLSSGYETSLSLYSPEGSLINDGFAPAKLGAPLARAKGGFWGTDIYTVGPGGELIRVSLNGGSTALGSGFGNVTAMAFGPGDALYLSEFSEDRILRIAPAPPPPNKPPTVVLTSPSHGASLQASSSLTIAADARDPDGQVTSVDFYANGAALSRVSDFPFGLILEDLAAGDYTLTAIATDNQGATATSVPVTITLLGLPSLVIGDASVIEGNVGTNVLFAVHLSSPSSQTVRIDFATVNGTALAGSDYVAVNGTLTFPPGQTDATISVSVLGDTVVEPDETFLLKLTNPINASIERTQGVATILNDDAPPVNTRPTLDLIADRVVDEDAPPQAIVLSGIGSGATNEIQALTIAVTSDNPLLIPSPTMVYSSPNATGILRFEPQPNAYGVAHLTVVVKDDGGTDRGGQDTLVRTFAVTIRSVNDLPTISGLPEQVTIPGSASLPLMITDLETPAEFLQLTAASSNPILVPASNVSFGGSGSNRIVSATPAAGQFGSATITITVTDSDNGTASASFTLMVPTVSNAAPTVTLTSPTNGAQFSTFANVRLTAVAADADGAISRVEFFRGTTRLGEDGVVPYDFSWNNPSPGSYDLIAIATDNRGAAATSAPVSIVVFPSVVFPCPDSDLQLSPPSLVSTNPLQAGQPIEVSVTLRHRGACEPTGVSLTAFLPEGVRVLSGVPSNYFVEANTVTFPIGRLPPGATTNLNLRLLPERPGLASIRFSVSADGSESHPLDNSQELSFEVAPARALPELRITSQLGLARIEVIGPPTQSYLLQYSTNLATWITLPVTPQPTTSGVFFDDPLGPATKAYRVLSP